MALTQVKLNKEDEKFNELDYHSHQVFYVVQDELWDASKDLDTVQQLYKELDNPSSLEEWYQQRAEVVGEEAEEETDGLITWGEVAEAVMEIACNDKCILEDLNELRVGTGMLPLQN